jgi:hypothetical protein
MPASPSDAAAARRALSVGVARFPDEFADLPYAAGLAAQLRQELAGLGYACGDPVATDCAPRWLGGFAGQLSGVAACGFGPRTGVGEPDQADRTAICFRGR